MDTIAVNFSGDGIEPWLKITSAEITDREDVQVHQHKTWVC